MLFYILLYIDKFVLSKLSLTLVSTVRGLYSFLVSTAVVVFLEEDWAFFCCLEQEMYNNWLAQHIDIQGNIFMIHCVSKK